MLETLRAHITLARNAFYDYRRYATTSFAIRSSGREHRRAIIRILTHYIEGGMSFPDVRLGYGQEKIQSIISKVQSYVADFGVDETVEWAISTLEDYVEYHRAKDAVPPEIERALSKLREQLGMKARKTAGGAELVTASDIRAATDFDFEGFLKNRHSVRQYAPGPIDDETIRRAVAKRPAVAECLQSTDLPRLCAQPPRRCAEGSRLPGRQRRLPPGDRNGVRHHIEYVASQPHRRALPGMDRRRNIRHDPCPVPACGRPWRLLSELERRNGTGPRSAPMHRHSGQ